MKTARRIVLAAATGGLLILCFPFPAQAWLAYMALIPLLIVIYEARPGPSFFYGWLSGVIFFSGLCYWVGFYGALPLILMGLIIGLFPAVSAALISFVVNRFKEISPPSWFRWMRPFIAPAVWVAMEFLRSETGLYSFPYGTLGYSQHGYGAVMNMASVLGVYGISFFLVFVNASIVELALAWREGLKRTVTRGAPALIVIMTAVLAAGALLQANTTNARGHGFKVALVQASIPQEQKWLESRQEEIMNRYKRLIKAAARARPDLIVLPEAALPAYVYAKDPLYRQLAGWAEETHTPILAGVPRLKNDGAYNTAELFDKQGQPAGSYAKMVPALFGEFVPFRVISEPLYPRLREIGDINRGHTQTVFSLRTDTPRGISLKFGALICSESLYSQLARLLGTRAVGAIFVLTNDAWFYNSNEPEQHFSMTKFRAVETGRYIAQSANTGVSGLIDPAGRVLARTAVGQKVVVSGMIRERTGGTLYTRFGYLFPYLLVLISALMTIGFNLVNVCTKAQVAGII